MYYLQSFILLNHLHLTLSKYLRGSTITALLVHLSRFFEVTSELTLNHSLFINSVLHFLVPELVNNTCLTSSLPRHNGHLPFC